MWSIPRGRRRASYRALVRRWGHIGHRPGRVVCSQVQGLARALLAQINYQPPPLLPLSPLRGGEMVVVGQRLVGLPVLSARGRQEVAPSPSRLTSQALFYNRRQRGQNVVPDLFQRLKTALADRYAIEEELGRAAWRPFRRLVAVVAFGLACNVPHREGKEIAWTQR